MAPACSFTFQVKSHAHIKKKDYKLSARKKIKKNYKTN